MAALTKTCKQCQEAKPIDRFAVVDRRGFRRGKCRDCLNAARRRGRVLGISSDFDFDWAMISRAMRDERVELSPDDKAVVVFQTLANGGQIREAARRARLTERSVQRIRHTPTHRAYKAWAAWQKYREWLRHG